MSEEENQCRGFSLRGWNHWVQLFRHGEHLSCSVFAATCPRLVGIIRAAPGELIELEASGWIQNCSGDLKSMVSDDKLLLSR